MPGACTSSGAPSSWLRRREEAAEKKHDVEEDTSWRVWASEFRRVARDTDDERPTVVDVLWLSRGAVVRTVV